LGYIGPLEHLYIVKYRLYSPLLALYGTLQAARDGLVLLLSSI